MPDTALPLVQEAITGKLIPIGIAMIVGTIGACYSAYVWLFKRQIQRIDTHGVHIDALNISREVLMVKLALVEESSNRIDTKHTDALGAQDVRHKESLVAQESRHKEDLKGLREETTRIIDTMDKNNKIQIDTMDKNNESSMDMLLTYLEQLVALGKERRSTDS